MSLNKSHKDLVADFMVLMEQWSPEAPKVDVSNLSELDVKNSRLRLKLILEELEEMFEAFLENETYKVVFAPLFGILQHNIDKLEKESLDIDRLAVLDAIVDQDYINSGTSVWLNLPQEEAFQAVHSNNLTKVDPITGKVIKRADGKILKSPSYVPVDLQPILDSHDAK